MRITRAEAWESLGGRAGPLGAWENLQDSQRSDLWRQMAPSQKSAIWLLFADRPDLLPEQPPAAEQQQDQGLFIDMAMAVAIAKQSGLTKDDLLAAIGLGEIEGITPEPGMKMVEREPLLAWLEGQDQLEDEDGPEMIDGMAVVGEIEIEGQMIKLVDSDVIRPEMLDTSMVKMTFWEMYGLQIQTFGAFAVIIASLVLIYLIYANV